MKNKIKYFKTILVLAIIAVIALIIGAALFATALKAIKEGGGGVIGGVFILVFFFLCIAISGALSLINLPFTVISVKRSEIKKFPIIALVIEIVIIAIALTLAILIIINNCK